MRMVGAGTDVIDGLPYRAAINSLLTDPSYFRITVNSVTYNPGSIDLDIEVMENVPDISNMYLRLAVTEDYLDYGGSTYHDVLLDMLPDVPITVSAVGEIQNATATFLDGAVPGNMDVVCFIQDDSNLAVLASASSQPTPDYSLRYYALGERQTVGPVYVPHTYEPFRVYNAGTVSDEFTVTVTGDIPDGWSAVLCDESMCYGTTYSETLAPGEYIELQLDVTATSTGYAPIDVEMTQAMVTPVFARAIAYTYFTDDLQVMLVDDDGAEAYEDYFIDALEFAGYPYGIWNRGAGAPTAAILANFPAVVWSCGWSFPTVDADDRAALSNYLDDGGSLFITGQDIGWELEDEGGAAYQWYQNYLHAIFVGDDTNNYTLFGVAGDPITDGLDIVIQGGDGANNQEYPSDIDPADGSATVIWTYDTYRNGALRADTGAYRVVYLAFGYEAIDNAADRREVLHRSLAWLTQDPADVAADEPGFRAFFSASPSPVVQQATLRFTLREAGAASLKVYGPDGRVVRTLVDGPLAAGNHVIDWDRTGDHGERLAAGVYYYHLQGGGTDLSRKAILLR